MNNNMRGGKGKGKGKLSGLISMAKSGVETGMSAYEKGSEVYDKASETYEQVREVNEEYDDEEERPRRSEGQKEQKKITTQDLDSIVENITVMKEMLKTTVSENENIKNFC